MPGNMAILIPCGDEEMKTNATTIVKIATFSLLLNVITGSSFAQQAPPVATPQAAPVQKAPAVVPKPKIDDKKVKANREAYIKIKKNFERKLAAMEPFTNKELAHYNLIKQADKLTVDETARKKFTKDKDIKTFTKTEKEELKKLDGAIAVSKKELLRLMSEFQTTKNGDDANKPAKDQPFKDQGIKQEAKPPVKVGMAPENSLAFTSDDEAEDEYFSDELLFGDPEGYNPNDPLDESERLYQEQSRAILGMITEENEEAIEEYKQYLDETDKKLDAQEELLYGDN
jgi:hypothetical protein